MVVTRIIATVFLFACLFSNSYADVLLIDSIAKQNIKGVAVPKHGLSQSEVRHQFGAPKQVIASVGDPPIGRWIYEQFTVYFESNYVIHTVIHRTQPPKPPN